MAASGKKKFTGWKNETWPQEQIQVPEIMKRKSIRMSFKACRKAITEDRAQYIAQQIKQGQLLIALKNLAELILVNSASDRECRIMWGI